MGGLHIDPTQRQVSIRLHEDTYARLAKKCKEEGITMKEAITRAILEITKGVTLTPEEAIKVSDTIRERAIRMQHSSN